MEAYTPICTCPQKSDFIMIHCYLIKAFLDILCNFKLFLFGSYYCSSICFIALLAPKLLLVIFLCCLGIFYPIQSQFVSSFTYQIFIKQLLSFKCLGYRVGQKVLVSHTSRIFCEIKISTQVMNAQCNFLLHIYK